MSETEDPSHGAVGAAAVAPLRDEGSRGSADPDYLETLARGLAVMLEMGRSGGTIAELARATRLPRPSVRRVLLTLCRLGYASESGRTYELTPKVTRLAMAYLGTGGRARMLQARCQHLADELGEIATVAVLDGDEQLHIAFGVPRNFVGIALGVGSRIPSYMTAAGRVMWAGRSDEEIDALLARTAPVARTERTLTDKSAIRLAILQARRDRYCVVDAEFSAEFKSVAFPILAVDGSLFGALTINAQKTALGYSDARFEQVVKRCEHEARELSSEVSR